MTELHAIYQSFVYCILMLVGAFSIAGLIFVGFRRMCSYYAGLIRSVPKSSFAVLMVFGVIATIHAQKPVYVDSSAQESGDGSKEHPFKTIPEALQKASVSTGRLDIAVASGTYQPIDLTSIPKDANGNDLSISLATYQRDGESNGVVVVDANGGDCCLKIPSSDATTNSVRGFLIGNARVGVENFDVSSCVLTECSDVALRNCSARNVSVSDCGGGMDGGTLTDSTISYCTNVVLRDVVVSNCHLTNNAALVAFNSWIDTCLIENNDGGVSNCTVYASSILSNRGCGISGDSVACNTLIAFNVDGDGTLANFTTDTVSMTNCCTAPMPSIGENNFYSAMPIYPMTHRLVLDSPVYRNGNVALLIQTKDLDGKNRVQNEETDIGAHFYATDPHARVDVPRDWYESKAHTYIENLLKADPRYYNNWREWVATGGTTLRLDSISTYPNTLVPYDYTMKVDAYKYGHYFYYNTIVNWESGKLGPNGVPLKWWEEYVLGTDPEDPDDYFVLSITMNDEGEPELSWNHNLGAERVYLIFGKKNLADEWVYVADGNLKKYNFFKVMVDMPE